MTREEAVAEARKLILESKPLGYRDRSGFVSHPLHGIFAHTGYDWTFERCINLGLRMQSLMVAAPNDTPPKVMILLSQEIRRNRARLNALSTRGIWEQAIASIGFDPITPTGVKSTRKRLPP